MVTTPGTIPKIKSIIAVNDNAIVIQIPFIEGLNFL
jgi:hypothetical protein